MKAAAAALAATAAAISLVSKPASAADVQLDWNVNWVEGVNPDGLMERRAIGVNGEWPPPVINVNASDSLTINFTNGFQDGRGSSLHSHGMFFNNTAYWDGAVAVTQCAIPPGSSIAYEPLNSGQSPADAQKQWGTYWTHGHYDGQYVDGLRTPSVIHADNEAHAYDDDFTVLLADWYHDEHAYLVKNEFLNVDNPLGTEPVPKSSLLYIAHTPKAGSAEYLSNFNEDVKLPFEAGKTYRLRIVNMAALAMFHFWIEGHDMRIIEADGVDTEEYPVDVVTISVAQRYSVLVTARNDTSENWLMHANMDPDMFDLIPDDLLLNRTMTVQYNTTSDAAVGSDRPTLDAYESFDDTALAPIAQRPMVEADVSHELVVDFTTYADGKGYAMFNDVTYVSALTPTLLTAMTMNPVNESNDVAVYGPNSNAIVAPHMAMVEIVITNLDTGNHPFHMHGTQFQVVHKSQDIESDDPEMNPPLVEGQANPMRRDTVVVPGGGAATLRFRADNPGAWFFHCHIDWHLTQGLAAVVLEAPELLSSRLTLPGYFAEQCAGMGHPSSGNAGGLQSLTDFGALPEGPKHLVTGWTANAVGTFVACLITALLGIGTICWYGFTTRSDDDGDDDGDDEADEEDADAATEGDSDNKHTEAARDPEASTMRAL